MIGIIGAHLRSRAALEALDTHLWKTHGQVPHLLEMAHVEAATSADALSVMMMLRDGSAKAQTGAWHIIVSPRNILADTEIRRVIDAIVSEYRAWKHPRLVWGHFDHPRAKSGGGAAHMHLVLAHVGPTLRALDMRQGLRRLEKTMRVLECELGEPPTLGRHHRSVLKALRGSRDDVVDWMTAVHGEQPEHPFSVMTSRRRAVAARAGLHLPRILAKIEADWARIRGEADAPARFHALLLADGLRIEPGRSAALVVRHVNGTLIGSLDRLVPAAVRDHTSAFQPREIHDGGDTPEIRGDGRVVPLHAPNTDRSDDGRDCGDARRGDARGGSGDGDPGDPDAGRGARSDPDDRIVAQGDRRAGGGTTTDRGAIDADRSATARSLLILAVQARAQDRRSRLTRRLGLLTRQGRVEERVRLAGRLRAHQGRLQDRRLDLIPEMPEAYLPAREAVRRTERAWRAAEEAALAASLPVQTEAQPARPLGARVRRWLSRRPAAPSLELGNATEPATRAALEHAERVMRDARRDLSRIEADHAAMVAATEPQRDARLALLSRRAAVIDSALHHLALDEAWIVRGMLALMRAAGAASSRRPGGAEPLPEPTHDIEYPSIGLKTL